MNMFDTKSEYLVSSKVTKHQIVKKSNAALKRFKVISLFSGCGGMDLGFKGGFDFLGNRYSENPFEII